MLFVLEYLTSKNDLRAAMQTCKLLYHLGFPLLIGGSLSFDREDAAADYLEFLLDDAVTPPPLITDLKILIPWSAQLTSNNFRVLDAVRSILPRAPRLRSLYLRLPSPSLHHTQSIPFYSPGSLVDLELAFYSYEALEASLGSLSAPLKCLSLINRDVFGEGPELNLVPLLKGFTKTLKTLKLQGIVWSVRNHQEAVWFQVDSIAAYFPPVCGECPSAFPHLRHLYVYLEATIPPEPLGTIRWQHLASARMDVDVINAIAPLCKISSLSLRTAIGRFTVGECHNALQEASPTRVSLRILTLDSFALMVDVLSPVTYLQLSLDLLHRRGSMVVRYLLMLVCFVSYSP